MNSKKGQGLSLNTMVIAVLGLGVLLVVVLIFMGVIKISVPGFKDAIDCKKQFGEDCVSGPSCGAGKKAVGAYCEAENTICCVPDDYLINPEG